MPPTPQELRQRRLALSATPTKAAPDAKALLDAANSASQTVAALHIAFMAVCAYVLVIVFGTTDLDLLMGGNNVKLPVIDVAVPIVGFYAFAPYLVVLMHLNLLLQLQLLSRKLFAFDAATPAEKGVGGLRDRLHIFPYTYYLVGRPGAVVGGLLGLVVSVTLIVLPLATLLAMQLKFLAYQAESITWAQRVAVFLNVGFLVALWPVILHPRDDWKAWWHETFASHLPRKRDWLAVIVLIFSVVLILLAATPDLFTVGLILGAVAPLLLAVLDGRFSDERTRRAITSFAVLLGLFAVLWIRIWGSEDYSPSSVQATIWGFEGYSPSSVQTTISVELFLVALSLAFFWHPTAPRGSLALLAALVLAPLLTLGLIVDGESWETATTEVQKSLLNWQLPIRRDQNQQGETLAQLFEFNRCASINQTVLSCVILAEQRRLDLEEQALFGKLPSPEFLAALRAGKGLKNKDKLERISLAERSLRRAQMKFVLLVGADLRNAQLQGAVLAGAQLQGAVLRLAQLQGANLAWAQLQGANLEEAQLQGAVLRSAKLQNANLGLAQLQGANFFGDELQQARLIYAKTLKFLLLDFNFGAELQGANLVLAGLQGANLALAGLQGANLEGAQLQGAKLERAQLHGANFYSAKLQGADLRDSDLAGRIDPARSDLMDVRGVTIRLLSKEEFSNIQIMLESIHEADSLAALGRKYRLELATTQYETPIFISCLNDEKSQPKCQQTYDATNPDQRREFMSRLHGVLAILACEDSYAAHGILSQIPDSDAESDSTRAGLATVLLARMKENPPCEGLAGLSAGDKAKLERLAKTERQQAAKAASAARQ